MRHDQHQPQSQSEANLSAWVIAWHIGYSIVVPLIVFVVGGILLDKSLHTLPTFTLVGLGVGFGVTVFTIFRRVKGILRENDRD